MTPAQIIAKARSYTGTDSANYPDATAIVDFNESYQDFCSDVVTELDENYFWDYLTTDWVALQNEYVAGDSNDPVTQINKVSVKYASGDSFTVATRINPDDLERDETWYRTNQPKTNPLYYVADNSVFLFPQFSDNVTGGVKIEVIRTPSDLTVSSTESEILIPKRFHKVIALGMRPTIHARKRELNEESATRQIYETEKREAITRMRARDQGVVRTVSGDLSRFC